MAPEKGLFVNRNTGRRLASPLPAPSIQILASDKRLSQPCSPPWPWITAQCTPSHAEGEGRFHPQTQALLFHPQLSPQPCIVLVKVFLALSAPRSAEGAGLAWARGGWGQGLQHRPSQAAALGLVPPLVTPLPHSAYSRTAVLNQGDLISQGTFCNVGRHFWLSQLGLEEAGMLLASQG